MVKLSLFFSLLMTVNNFNSTAVTVRQPTAPSSIVMTQEELRFVELTNRERASRGLSQLTIDPLLVETARKHSREMAEKRYFSHDSPTPGLKTPLDRYLAKAKQKPSWALVGENLFYCSLVDVSRGHNALMGSEGHRENLLESRFDHIGVGTYINSHGEFYVTQMFLAKTD